MIIVAAVLLATTSVLLSLAAAFVHRRVRPATFAVVFTAASVTVAFASSGVLAVACWYGAARIGPIAAIGGWSSALLSQRTPVSLPVSVCAGVIATTMVLVSGRLWSRRIGELRSAHRTWAIADRSGVAVTPDANVDAFAVDGTATTRRVVLTMGLLRELPEPALQRAVIEHERSHLRHHHLLYRLGVETATATNPLLRPIRRYVDEALEAWADDDAAAATAPATVATAIATVALARTRRHRHIVLAVADTSTTWRIERLLKPENSHDAGAIIGAAIVLSTFTIFAVCCRHTETFFEVLRIASSH